MKNENSKGKAFLLLSMIAFFIMSATFLVMPLIQTNIDSGSNAYNIIIGIISVSYTHLTLPTTSRV